MKQDEPLKVSIPADILANWIECLRKGLNPQVGFSGDYSAMLQEAYKLRGEVIATVYADMNTCLNPI